MIALTAGEIAVAVGGRLSAIDSATLVTDVAVDSRSAGAGALFVAIRGERVDGHDFAEEVIGAGAAAVLAARPLQDQQAGRCPASSSTIRSPHWAGLRPTSDGRD